MCEGSGFGFINDYRTRWQVLWCQNSWFMESVTNFSHETQHQIQIRLARYFSRINDELNLFNGEGVTRHKDIPEIEIQRRSGLLSNHKQFINCPREHLWFTIYQKFEFVRRAKKIKEKLPVRKCRLENIDVSKRAAIRIKILFA